jgi:hypothetical protein
MFFLMGCKTKNVIAKPEGENSQNSRDVLQKSKAYELGKRVLTTCNTSEFKPFTAIEATHKVISNTTLAKLSKICLKFNEKYGAFKDLQFVEMILNKTDKIRVYRFKAHFENKSANKELRVSINQEDKVTAITTKDWKVNFE